MARRGRGRNADAPRSLQDDELREATRRAVRLEWLTIAYLASAIVVVFFTLGSSQAMKAAWIEDVLSLLPPIAFLVALRLSRRPPTARRPYGEHRATSIAYLFASLALLLVGLYVLVDSGLKLAKVEHPPIGTVVVLGEQVWQGWLMLAAIAYTGIPPVLLGRAKLPLADRLHDKVLYADAEMNRADWMTAAAAAVGVVGIGFGVWFADAVAGAFIALDIVRDGVRNVRAALADLLDARPRTYDDGGVHPVVARAQAAVDDAPWVHEGVVRVRELGHVFSCEAFVVPRSTDGLLERVAELADRLRAIDDRIEHLAIAPSASLPDDVPRPV